MNYKKIALEFHILLNHPIYLCDLGSNTLYSCHSGSVYDSPIPGWLADFISVDDILLEFEHGGELSYYVKMWLDNSSVLISLNNASFSLYNIICSKIFSTFLTNNNSMETIANRDKELSDLKIHLNVLASELKRIKSEDVSLKEKCDILVRDNAALFDKLESKNEAIRNLDTEIEELRSINKEQAGRLKDALSKNLELAKKAKIVSMEEMDFLQGALDNTEENYQRLLSYIIRNLNNIINTTDASGVNIVPLSIIMPIDSPRDLENNPILVKSLISKLIGMDRTGRLTYNQLKHMKEAFSDIRGN